MKKFSNLKIIKLIKLLLRFNLGHKITMRLVWNSKRFSHSKIKLRERKYLCLVLINLIGC